MKQCNFANYSPKLNLEIIQAISLAGPELQNWFGKWNSEWKKKEKKNVKCRNVYQIWHYTCNVRYGVICPFNLNPITFVSQCHWSSKQSFLYGIDLVSFDKVDTQIIFFEYSKWDLIPFPKDQPWNTLARTLVLTVLLAISWPLHGFELTGSAVIQNAEWEIDWFDMRARADESWRASKCACAFIKRQTIKWWWWWWSVFHTICVCFVAEIFWTTNFKSSRTDKLTVLRLCSTSLIQ